MNQGLFWLSLVMHLNFSICHELDNYRMRRFRIHYSERSAKKCYYPRKKSLFAIQYFLWWYVQSISGLGMASIALACFVKLALYFLRYSLFEIMLYLNSLFLQFHVVEQSTVCLDFIFVNICRRGGRSFQSFIFIIKLTVKQRVMVMFSLMKILSK